MKRLSFFFKIALLCVVTILVACTTSPTDNEKETGDDPTLTVLVKNSENGDPLDDVALSVEGMSLRIYSQCGFVYGITPMPTKETGKIIPANSTPLAGQLGQFSATSTITQEGKYYVRAYVIVGDNPPIYYPKETSESFEIKYIPPTFIKPILRSTNIAEQTATFETSITLGTFSIKEKGFVFGQSPDINTATCLSRKISSTTTDGNHIDIISNIPEGGPYYARAYIIDSNGGEFYSNYTEFNFKSTPPIFIQPTLRSVNISEQTATFETSITIGTFSIKEKGFIFGGSPDVTIASCLGRKISSTTTAGSHIDIITNIQDEGIYYAKAYVIDSKGKDHYSNYIAFDFKAVMPNPTTLKAGNVAMYSASLYGTISSIGDPPYLEKGFVWAENNTNPTLENSKKETVSIPLTGQFSYSLTGLSDGTTYGVNTYAIYPNKPAVYGSPQSFTTHFTLSGNVKDSQTNMAIGNATVVIKQGSSIVAQATTNSTGYFSVSNLATGTYQVNVTAGGYADKNQSRSISPEQKTIDISLEKLGGLSGVLKDDDGIPIQNASVKLYPSGSSTLTASTNTDQNGEFTLNELVPRQYAMTVVADNHDGIYQRPINILSGANSCNLAMDITNPILFDLNNDGF